MAGAGADVFGAAGLAPPGPGGAGAGSGTGAAGAGRQRFMKHSGGGVGVVVVVVGVGDAELDGADGAVLQPAAPGGAVRLVTVPGAELRPPGGATVVVAACVWPGTHQGGGQLVAAGVGSCGIGLVGITPVE